MIVAVKTREFKRDLDYDWEDYFPSNKALVSEAGALHRALEGADVDSRFAAFFRQAAGVGVTLGVSISTTRKDAVGRPIRTIAFLRATDSKEMALLVSFFAECLSKDDKKTLDAPESDVAKAVESLYQKKNADEFVRICKTLPPVGGNGSTPKKRVAFPREGMEGMRERQSLANALSTVIEGNSPFLFALTDRLPTDVLGSLGSMFDHATVRIFSKAVDCREDIPEPASQKYRRAAAIGGAAILVLFAAAIGTCSRGSRQEEANNPNPPGGGTVGGTSTSTNRQVLGRIVPPAITNASKQEATVTNAPPASQIDSGGTITNVPPQETAVTNNLKSASAGAEKEKTENE